MIQLALATCAWSGELRSSGSAIDPRGQMFLVGSFRGELTVGAQRVRSAGGTDVYVLKLDRDGRPVWIHRFGGALDDDGESIVVLPDGALLLTGSFAGEIAFGDDRLVAVGGRDVFVARLDDEGRPEWSRSYGSPGPTDPLAEEGELRVVMLDGSWAEVWLNGEKLETTAPLARHALPAGRYEVRLENTFSGLHHLQVIDVAAGETVTIRAAP